MPNVPSLEGGLTVVCLTQPSLPNIVAKDVIASHFCHESTKRYRLLAAACRVFCLPAITLRLRTPERERE
jgi:hypothetical protein